MSINKDLLRFRCGIALVLLLTIAPTLLYIGSVFYSDPTYKTSICFSPDCFERFVEPLKKSAELIDFIIKIIVSVVTVAGVYYALLNYITSSAAARTNVHLLHLNTFRDYILNVSSKDTLIDIKSINILKWYNLAFPKSNEGLLVVGEDYVNLIKKFSEVIVVSNSKFDGTNAIKYSYKEHQTAVISQIKLIGFNIQRLPKNDFFEVENALISLINNVNSELCRSTPRLPVIPLTKFK